MTTLFNVKSTLLLAVLCFSALFVFSQSDNLIIGQVVDADTGAPIKDVTVTPVGFSAKQTGFTDELGFFYLDLDSVPTQLYIRSLQYDELITYNPPATGVYVIALQAKSHHLGEAEVTAFQLENRQLNSPSNVGVITAKELRNSDGSDLQWAMNQVPGVIMETRGYGGSRRLNIRGTTVRSPFAVRNIKMYLDELPLTNPDGSSPLELMDPMDISRIEVIKGPAGSAYGSINGGTLLFTPRSAGSTPVSLRSNLQFGSFGYFRSSQAIALSQEKIKLRIHRVDQSLEGYRAQEFNHKEQTTLSLNINASNRLQYLVWATDYSGNWGLPGAINANDVSEDPSQARVYAVQNNTRVERDRQYIGVRQRWTTRHLTNQTAVYVTQTKKVNPYGTSPFFNGYKNESGQGYGARTKFTGSIIKWEHAALSGTAGAEFQTDVNDLDEFELTGGLPTNAKFSNSTESVQGMAFAGLQFNQGDLVFVEAGIGWTETIYTNTGTNFVLSGDSADLRTRLPYRALLPRLAASFRVTPHVYVYANANTGTSAPSVFEVVNPYDGRFSEQLVAEDASNVELGIKGYSPKWKLQGEITAYRMNLQNPILENAESEGPLYFNLNESRVQQGLEMWIQKDWSFDNHPWMDHMSVNVNSTLNGYGYASDSLEVPGTPFATAQIQFTAAMRSGMILVFSDRWTDAMFLNSAGTVKSNAYHLGQLEVRYQEPFFNNRLKLELQFGVRNLWDAEYSSFFQLDGVFGRYYNPAPPRSFFGGVALNVAF